MCSREQLAKGVIFEGHGRRRHPRTNSSARFSRNQCPSPLASFSFSRDSCIHWPRLFYGEVHNDDGNILRKFHVNPFYHLGDMEKTTLLQEVVLVVFQKKGKEKGEKNIKGAYQLPTLPTTS